MSNLIIDVVPRIDTNFKMPNIESIPDNETCLTEQPEVISKKQKIMMDIGSCLTTYKYHIIVTVLCIIIIVLIYYLYKKYYCVQTDCNSETESNIDETPDDDNTSIKSIEESISDIDDAINKIINDNSNQQDDDKAEIDEKINNILNQTNDITANDDIDNQIINILNENKIDKVDNLIDNKINNIINSTIIEEEAEIPVIYDADNSLDE